ncbi:MAG TPA: EAL domain-containing protein [Beijerinckiaceae bacterium]|nr:EAL domain-containing protein [Beijerinckiaceae bacterium]
MLNEFLSTAEHNSPEAIRLALAAIRKHLGMEVAYISEFVENRSVFREVDAPGLEAMIKVGDSHSLDDVYCRHILAGRLPELMADTGDYAFAQAMPITHAVPIGAHMSVPIRARDGSALGMFCCLSPHANRSLNDRDLNVMRVFADMAAHQIVGRMEFEQSAQRKRAEIARVIAEKAFKFVYQPIWDFRSNRPTGFEALCRFAAEPYRSPDKWFNEAFEVDCGIDLELAVLDMALGGFRHLPEEIYLSLNTSPATILSGELARVLATAPMHRLVLEVTEHAPVEDYAALSNMLAPLRAAGARIAIDDAGAGYAGLQHIIRLSPDIIKLDISLTRTIDVDPARRALASALIFFARETGCVIIAEGIETVKEQEILELLGVPRGQGYFLGRPVDLQSAQALVRTPDRQKAG